MFVHSNVIRVKMTSDYAVKLNDAKAGLEKLRWTSLKLSILIYRVNSGKYQLPLMNSYV